MKHGRPLVVGFASAVLAVAALGVIVGWLNVRGEEPVQRRAAFAAQPADAPSIARGEYLVRIGDCAACHTAPGSDPFAGGRIVETPFGGVFSSNLTPDIGTGLGAWSADEFWRALHHGRSKSGRLLYPAFPYPNYTRVVRSDADAMFAYLQSLPAVERATPANTLRFPYDTQVALAVWRALFFQASAYKPDPQRSARWNRGAYLVEGLGHCSACHSARNALGATSGPLDLQGGLIPVQNWYAPSLASPHEAGVAEWPLEETVRLLRTGVAERGSVMGPMSEVVRQSTQYLDDVDAMAIADYLKALPAPPEEPPAPSGIVAAPNERGATLYRDHCAECHGVDGRGVAGAYPALAGSRAVTMRSTVNLVHVVLEGGFPPTTAGNPRPFGMPPFTQVLDNAGIADVLSYIRGAWGNRAPPMSALDVAQARNNAGR